MALLAAAIHEAGHALAFILLFGRLPHLRIELTGIALNIDGQRIPIGKEQKLLVAGSLANFIVAIIAYLYLFVRASYSGYFFASENLLIGLFNLLPIEFMDGGRLLENSIGLRDGFYCRIISLMTMTGLVLTMLVWLYASHAGMLPYFFVFLIGATFIASGIQE
ncbi:MAG: site-2 protease family protein [Pygmaiobacter sp.]